MDFRAEQAAYARRLRASRRACFAAVPTLPDGVRAVLFITDEYRQLDEAAAQTVCASLRASGAVVLLPRRRCPGGGRSEWSEEDAFAADEGNDRTAVCACLTVASSGALADAADGRPAPPAVRAKDGKMVR